MDDYTQGLQPQSKASITPQDRRSTALDSCQFIEDPQNKQTDEAIQRLVDKWTGLAERRYRSPENCRIPSMPNWYRIYPYNTSDLVSPTLRELWLILLLNV